MNRDNPDQQFWPGTAVIRINCQTPCGQGSVSLALYVCRELPWSPCEGRDGLCVPSPSLFPFRSRLPPRRDFSGVVSRCSWCFKTGGLHVYPEVANAGFPKSLSAPYFPVFVQFAPKTRITLKETSVICKSREMSGSHGSVAPIQTDAQSAQLTISA